MGVPRPTWDARQRQERAERRAGEQAAGRWAGRRAGVGKSQARARPEEGVEAKREGRSVAWENVKEEGATC